MKPLFRKEKYSESVKITLFSTENKLSKNYRLELSAFINFLQLAK